MPPRRSAKDQGEVQPHLPRGRHRALADGRQQTLVYLPPELVKALKFEAVERDTSVSRLVERAISEWIRHVGSGRR